jgi:hypothetical protein
VEDDELAQGPFQPAGRVEQLGDVRLWFADEVVAQWLPSDESKPATIITSREALIALIRFMQRAFAAYQASNPAGTFTEQS